MECCAFVATVFIITIDGIEPVILFVAFSTCKTTVMDPMLNTSLEQADPDVYALIEKEKHRQKYGLELIASEV